MTNVLTTLLLNHPMGDYDTQILEEPVMTETTLQNDAWQLPQLIPASQPSSNMK